MRTLWGAKPQKARVRRGVLRLLEIKTLCLYILFFVLYKSGAAGQEPCANAARDKRFEPVFHQGERGGRE